MKIVHKYLSTALFIVLLASHPLVAAEQTIDKAWPFTGKGDETAVGADKMLSANFYVVLDGSGSMQGRGCSGKLNKMDAAKKALLEFAGLVPAQANLGLVTFDNNGVKEQVPLAAGNRDDFVAKVQGMQAGGGTPLRSAITLAYDKLTAQGRRQLGYGEYHLVVVTDGEASPGENPEKIVNQVLGNSPLVIHTIGFCIDTAHSLNQAGRILYRTATDYDSLKQGLQGVLAEAPAFTATDFK